MNPKKKKKKRKRQKEKQGLQPSDSETESDDDSSKPPPNTSTRPVRRTLEVAKKAKDRPKKNTLPPVPPSNAPLPPVTNQRSAIRDACETLDDAMVLVNKVTHLQSVLHPSSTPPVAPPVSCARSASQRHRPIDLCSFTKNCSCVWAWPGDGITTVGSA